MYTFLYLFFFNITFCQIEWIDSEGEKSYIFVKTQYDSLLAKSERIQSELNQQIQEKRNIEKELKFYKNLSLNNNSSNILINQITPLKSHLNLFWFSSGILGGIFLCQLLNQ